MHTDQTRYHSTRRLFIPFNTSYFTLHTPSLPHTANINTPTSHLPSLLRQLLESPSSHLSLAIKHITPQRHLTPRSRASSPYQASAFLVPPPPYTAPLNNINTSQHIHSNHTSSNKTSPSRIHPFHSPLPYPHPSTRHTRLEQESDVLHAADARPPIPRGTSATAITSDRKPGCQARGKFLCDA